jgi:hypothetical protein
MAIFSGLYHPTDMSMLQNMLTKRQQQRQFEQKMAMEAPLRAAQMEQAQATAELNRQKAAQTQALLNLAGLTPQAPGVSPVSAMQPGMEPSVDKVDRKVPSREDIMFLLTGKEMPSAQMAREERTAFLKQRATDRAKGIEELGNIVAGGVELRGTLNQLENTLASPDFESIKQNPLLMGRDLLYYKTQGTPEQQKVVANLQALTGQIVADMAGKFKGQFRIGEQALIEGMKVDPKDPLNIAFGKFEAMKTLNEMAIERNQIAADLMEEQGLSKYKALLEADKSVEGDATRAQVEAQLAGKREAAKTAKQKTMPEKMSAGSKILARDLEMPKFATKEEAVNWYNQQPKTVQNAIKLKYQGGK